MFDLKTHEFEVEGRKITFESGKLAPKSQVAIQATMGDTVILVTVNVDEPFGDANFFPMSVEYIEKMYASGKINGSRFIKRERFPSDEAILKARMMDRAFRSRFPSDYRNPVSVLVTVMSYDETNDPLLLGINAASAALMLSKIPFQGPVAGVKVGYKDDKTYPIFRVLEDTDEEEKMNYVLTGDGEKFTMVDANSHEVGEDAALEAMKFGLEQMKTWTKGQEDFVALFDKVVKDEYESFANPKELIESMKEKFGAMISKGMEDYANWDESAAQAEVYAEYEGTFAKAVVKETFNYLAKQELRRMILEDKKRVDGRALDKVRELGFEVDLLPKVHGSGLFTRERTQSLTTVTLGSTRMEKLYDNMAGEGTETYMHYYNAMPFSYGEAGRIRWIPGRREVGHSGLAQKALKPVLPSLEEFPYTIVVMSEVLSQNGSSSMAATCGSTLALMAAGVPIKRPVAGIAMGVVTNEDMSEYEILTDIQGVEDFYGDMDFKVTGTDQGITAIQMDNKAAGLPLEIFEKAIGMAKDARIHILTEMAVVIDEPRKEVAKGAPKVEVCKIPTAKIGELIGPGGKNIREISEKYDVELDVEEDGTVNIFGDHADKIALAKEYVDGLSFVAEAGATYEGTVDSVVDYGAFIEIAPGVTGLLHISELADGFVKEVTEFVNEGDVIKVKVLEVDRDGKMKLSMKALKEEKKEDKKEK